MSKQNDVIINNENNYTLYCVGISDKFRIKQISDNEFIVQKQFKETETKGYLWWKDTHTWNKWKRVDKNGQKYYSKGIHMHISNADRLKPIRL